MGNKCCKKPVKVSLSLRNSEDILPHSVNSNYDHFDKLPLKNKQIYLLKANWKGIQREIEKAGIEMFVR